MDRGGVKAELAPCPQQSDLDRPGLLHHPSISRNEMETTEGKAFESRADRTFSLLFLCLNNKGVRFQWF